MAVSDLQAYRLDLSTESYDYRTPMKFGGRIVRDVTVLTVDCHANSQLGTGTGLGSMTMGIAWAWPSSDLDAALRLDLVLTLAHRLAEAYQQEQPTGHPLDICLRMVAIRRRLAKELERESNLAEPIPTLAVLLAASPIEAALFDAHGQAAGTSSYALLSPEHLPGGLEQYLDESFAGCHLSDYVATQPVNSLPLYHLVGALDPLTDDDIDQPVGDGLPESLADWIDRDGLTHLKIKLDGADGDWDARRVIRIDEVATSQREIDWTYSLDFNERCPREEDLLRLLKRLESNSPRAWERIAYIEQPTHRDLTRLGQPTMHRAAKLRPVVIDESLVDLASLKLARDQGYSGIALKACKGHAEALLLGAAAAKLGMYRCVQDLTCVGASLLHSASLAAHLPGIRAIESNGRQYAPAGNAAWSERFADFFEVRNGSLPTGQLNGPGLGYSHPGKTVERDPSDH